MQLSRRQGQPRPAARLTLRPVPTGQPARSGPSRWVTQGVEPRGEHEPKKMPDTLRIGCGAGFSADRLDPAVDLARRGRLDWLVFECLGERTMAFGHRDRLRDPGARLQQPPPASPEGRAARLQHRRHAHPHQHGRGQPARRGRARKRDRARARAARPAHRLDRGRRGDRPDRRPTRRSGKAARSPTRASGWSAPTPISASRRCCRRSPPAPISSSPAAPPILPFSWRPAPRLSAGLRTTGRSSAPAR